MDAGLEREPRSGPPADGPAARLRTLRDRFFLQQLQRYPVVSTFLGGDGWQEGLDEANGRLRDTSPEAIQAELAEDRDLEAELATIDVDHLDPQSRVDARLIQAQLAFLIHQLGELRYHERAVDTYVAEPFRGIDWQLQQMQPMGSDGGDAPGPTGTDDEWQRLVSRVRAVPEYVDRAVANLERGLAAGNAPDHRLVHRDGIAGSEANAAYFRGELPGIAAERLGGSSSRGRLMAEIDAAAREAAEAFDRLAAFLRAAPWPGDDRYAICEAEYHWRARNNLGLDQTVDDLWTRGGSEVAAYHDELFRVAGDIGRRAGLGLRFGTANDRAESVAAVVRELGRDAPADDDERLAWYVATGRRAIEYGREQALFAIPDDYRLDVVPTPPLLRQTLEAAYYPAAPLKPGGVGRFYLTPTGNDPAALAMNGRASIATVAVHEGFPGHDWHYRTLAARGPAISPVRWLTPGAVEDSSSMWSDSMSIEGWGLYSEQLMGEPADDRPHGFFTLDEQFYYLYWNLRRAMRVRVDVGLHTGRMTYDEAVDWWVANQDFVPDARARAAAEPAAKAVLDAAERNIYRYTKWPTQAITYNIGRASIRELRAAFLGARPGTTPRDFHEWYLGQGTVPASYLRELL
ncbi:MAG TPA: DUF885 domain-containing protein [Candidatus Limnocylindrales bacterium]|nr:DUF885 domain-containing protein [Candidatus Limnocylindrales bacterium]